MRTQIFLVFLIYLIQTILPSLKSNAIMHNEMVAESEEELIRAFKPDIEITTSANSPSETNVQNDLNTENSPTETLTNKDENLNTEDLVTTSSTPTQTTTTIINPNLDNKPTQAETNNFNEEEKNTEETLKEEQIEITENKINNEPVINKEAVETSTTIQNENTPQQSSETTTTNTPSNEETPQQQQQQTNTESKQAQKVVEVVVNKNKDDMQSFEEWKEMKLKDKSKPKVEKPPSQVGNNENEKDSEDKSMRRLKNYASLDCGAKIVAYNAESSNPSHILTESKDDYMLNSCSSRVWFVLELCEPVKIARLELANFELFSNVPRQFRVYASERYLQSANGKDWPQKYLFGTFEAANSRSIQSFSVGDITESSKTNGNSTNPKFIMFAKYVKFEMLSHYGTEHYCPLSLVRVYGSSMADEEEEDALQNNDAEDLEQSNNNQEKEIVNEQVITATTQPPPTTTPATNTISTPVINLPVVKETSKETKESADKNIVSGIKGVVKEAINQIVGGSSNQQAIKNKQAPKNNNGTFSNLMNNLIPLLIRHNFNINKIFENKFDNANRFAFSKKIKEIELNLSGRPSKSTMIEENKTTVRIVTSNTLNASKNSYNSPIEISSRGSDEVLKAHENVLHIDLNRLVCFTDTRMPFLGEYQLGCCQCWSRKKLIKETNDLNWLFKYCSYYFLITSTSQTFLNNSLITKYLNNVKLNLNNESSLTNMTLFTVNKVEFLIGDEFLENRRKAIVKIEKSKNDDEYDDKSVKDIEVVGEVNVEIESQTVEEQSKNEKSIILNENDEKSEQSLVEAKTELDNQKNYADVLNEVKESEVKNDDSSQSVETSIPPAPTTTTAATTTTTTTTTTSPISTSDTLNNQLINTESATQATSTTTSTSTATTTTSSTSTPTATAQPQIVIANGKEAVFIRLSNRIRTLELNMSLSSQYLEKLSQHYRKQMEEMEKAFNLTTTALIDTTRIADERDLKYNDQLKQIEGRLDNVEHKINTFNSFLDDLKFKTEVLKWTVIILNVALTFELIRCIRNGIFRKKNLVDHSNKTNLLSNNNNNNNNKNNNNKSNQQLNEQLINKLLNSPKINKQIELIVEKQLKILLEQQISKVKLTEQQKKLVSRQVKNAGYEEGSSNNDVQQQQQVAAAAAATLAMVAAVRLATASFNQATEEIDSFKSS